jgi:polysaccharide biosynthesis/export protein
VNIIGQIIGQRVFRAGRYAAVALVVALSGCAGLEELPAAQIQPDVYDETTEFRIGSGDSFTIFVWRNPELSTGTSVRPDGKITIPLIEDLPVTGKTPTQVAREIEKKLAVYVQDPIVVVMMRSAIGPLDDQIRIVGEASRPQALPYRSTMTLLDVMIAVGGITDFAAGNRATLMRLDDGKQVFYRLRIDDLLRDGDMSANVKIRPGDVIVVPEAWF